jgi:hypothetical protein
MGGSEYPGLGGLSELDIERIAALYPPALVEPDPVVGGPNEKRSGDASALPAKQPTLEVIFPGELTTTVRPVPAPTDSAKPPNLKDGDSTASCLTMWRGVSGRFCGFSVVSLSVILEEDPTGFFMYQRISMRVGGIVIAETFGEAICFRMCFLSLCLVKNCLMNFQFRVLPCSSRGRYKVDEILLRSSVVM